MRLVYYDIVIVFMQSIDHRSLPLAAKTASIENKNVILGHFMLRSLKLNVVRECTEFRLPFCSKIALLYIKGFACNFCKEINCCI